MKKTAMTGLIAMGISAVAVTACGGAGEGASQPTEIRTTWFGISNFHYQIGSTGIILDGEVVNTGSAPSPDRKSTRLNSSHSQISYAVFCLKKKKRHKKDTSSRKNINSTNIGGRKGPCADDASEERPRDRSGRQGDLALLDRCR